MKWSAAMDWDWKPLAVISVMILITVLMGTGLYFTVESMGSESPDTTLYEGTLIGVDYTESFGREHTILNLNNTVILINDFTDGWHIGSYYRVWLDENKDLYDREEVSL